ncbi:unnamed protein product [Vitrella brassicaformis CCMP3155]|uniref:DNA-(apurinic or apyrimidinic site) lyase n=2 Tax=Vitrella brassicaformis TaxID=1169539 RepID=A0A0G4ECR9_VITBC|nr:unnamed protein product [Vitrella brassicaformis CCMP3155]|eukprot:CEL93771.1 unnamed protein product [Vitrella brassicaformis CCMP3155]
MAAAATATATAASKIPWTDLQVPPPELQPEFCLVSGQCFSFKPCEAEAGAVEAPSDGAGDGVSDSKEWVGVIGRGVYHIRQTEQTTLFRCLHHSRYSSDGSECVAEVREFFRLHTEMAPLYRRWEGADARMRQIVPALRGARVIQQDATECLFTFICSSNNNISRITLMIDRLKRHYGDLIATITSPTPTLTGAALQEHQDSISRDGSGGGLRSSSDERRAEEEGGGGEHAGSGYSWYSFPTIDRLAAASEQGLRSIGLGYRAKSVVETAKALKELGGEAFLQKLKSPTMTRQEVQKELLQFRGVGRKVADCVGLFSLDRFDAIPVDTHVWRIACRDLDRSLQSAKSLTPAVYDRVGDLFRDRYGSRAGWAHSLLFTAELPAFRARLPASLQQEMSEFAVSEKEAKKTERAARKRRRTGAEGEGEGEEEGEGEGDGGGDAEE